VQAQSWLLAALQNPNALQARDTWNSFNALPLARRHDLPLYVFSHLAKIQKTLQLKRRGLLWERLSSIYQIWQQQECIPVEELRDTLQMLRYWFEQKDVPQNKRSFGFARQLCCDIARLLNPYSEIELLEMEQLADIIHDYGSPENLVDVASSFGMALESRENRQSDHGTRSTTMKDVYSRLVSGLAQRGKVKEALTLTSRATANGVPIHVGDCGRDVIVAIYAISHEESEKVSEVNSLMERVANLESMDHPISQWYRRLEGIGSQVAQIDLNNEKPDWTAIFMAEDDQEKVAISFLKNRIRQLVSYPHSMAMRQANVSEVEKSRIAVQTLHKALEAMSLYEEHLSKGFETDRELYRIVKMAKRRVTTYSGFSPLLREAAYLRTKEERAKDARNFKKKWLAPRMITAHWEHAEATEHVSPDYAVEMQDGPSTQSQRRIQDQQDEGLIQQHERSGRRNIYADATSGQILHLAIELGDTELARALVPVVMKDTTFSWTLQHDDRALSLLSTLIQDATRADMTRQAKQTATQLACSFYTSWQDDLAKYPQAHIEQRGQVERTRRSPAFHLLRLLAHHQEQDGFTVAMQALVQDPSVRLAESHMQLFARHIARSSTSLPWIALKLHIAKDALTQFSRAPLLAEALYRAVMDIELDMFTFEERVYLRWCDTVLHHMQHSGYSIQRESLEAVLAMYEGHKDLQDDSLAAHIVAGLHKADIKPASKIETLFREARAHTAYNAIAPFLNHLEEGSVALAAPVARDVIKELVAKKHLHCANLLYELFVAVSDQDANCDAPLIAETIEAMEAQLGLLRPEQAVAPIVNKSATAPLKTLGVNETMQEFTENAQIPAPVILSHEVARQGKKVFNQGSDSIIDKRVLSDFLGEFFSDSHHTEKKHQHDWLQPDAQEAGRWNEAAVGFPDAVGPEQIQAAAASVQGPVIKDIELRKPQLSSESSNSRATSGTPVLATGFISSQSYSTLASQPGVMPSGISPHASILQELSQLPQQFADLTMEQVLALKRRCEIEMEAMRRKDEKVLAARRISLSRADASRWQGWQEFQATPWY